MVGKSIYSQVIPQQSTTLKMQQICHYRHARKTFKFFLLCNTGVEFSFGNNFANLGSFAKVSVSVQPVIP